MSEKPAIKPEDYSQSLIESNQLYEPPRIYWCTTRPVNLCRRNLLGELV